MAEAIQQPDFHRVSVAMGARVDGFDFSRGVSPEDIRYLRQLLLEHHLLVIPNQELSAVELEMFGRSWGDLLTHPATKHRDTPYVQWIGGKDRRFKFSRGVHAIKSGRYSDMTWHATPPRITGLHARQLPSSGGDTAFANQHYAYDTLDSELQEKIRGL